MLNIISSFSTVVEVV